MNPTRLLLPILSLGMILLISCQNKQQGTVMLEESKNLIVLVRYKTQPSKSEEAVAGFTKLIESVQKEPYFISITMLVDPADDSNILLCEEWSNAAYYNGDHMTTAHLQSFMTESRAYLAGPPEISQWAIEKRFNAN